MMMRIQSIYPQRRGFRHYFRVVVAGLDEAGGRDHESVFVNEDELYNYHRFQLASLTQLGRLCRFPLEDQAETPHQLQMLWNRELSSAPWGGLREATAAQSDAETLGARAERGDRLRETDFHGEEEL
ncbi:MAG: hypothetical protein KY475_16570 [Planctomycetes bacterium]|nr:hypothetical protein [Planctomycetota bacterium]